MKNTFSLLFGISLIFSGEKVIVNNSNPGVELISSNLRRTVLNFEGGDFTKSAITINGKEYFHLDYQGEPTLLETGNPQLPKMVRSIIIPDNAKMEINILESEFKEFNLAVAPSKGSITRNIDPKTIPFTFSEVYKTDEFYPAEIAELGDPYIMRDVRGMTVTAFPFQYNPVTNTLRVYTKIAVEVIENGLGTQNVKTRESSSINKHFSSLYSEHFINYDRTRYDTVEERGRMIVIAYGDFMSSVQPYVDWKNQKGIKTDLYDVYEMGSNSTGIKNFIQSQYDQNNGLCFVQLVGDHAQVPTIMVSNGGGGGSDPSFSLLEGNDPYPEIFVGRFSASSLSHVQTQVERTIHYERDIDSGAWLHKGSGIASNQGPGDDGEYDDDHSAIIRDKLLDYTYTFVDEIYDPSGTDQQGINAINDGRGIINYTGHGSETSWGNGASLNITQVNSLTNDEMLPHVISVGCVNGAFENTTCFGEAWLRATNNSTGNPTGAVAFYASTVNQYWNEPMRAQDHAMDLLVGYNYSNNSPLDKKYTIGGLWYNGSCNMMDVYSQSGIDMFLTWIIFGDASLDIRSETPSPISASHTGTLFIGDEGYEVSTNVTDALVAVSNNGTLLGSGYTDGSGNVVLLLSPPPDEPGELTLTITGYNRITKVDPISVVTPSGPYIVVADYSAETSDDDVVEFGEDATLSVTLENIGIESASNVVASFNSFDQYVTIENESSSFGTIPPNSSETVSSACTFFVSESVPNNHNINFNVSIQSNTGEWEENIIVMAYSPIVEADGFSVSNDNNGNGNLDPGESASLNVTLRNSGGADAHNVTAILSSSHPGITISGSQSEVGSLNDNSTEVVSYSVSASQSIPLGQGVVFDLAVTADNNYYNGSSFVVTVGLALEDFESGAFTSYPWEFSGYSIQWPGIDPVEDFIILDTLENAEWEIENEDSYSGSFSAKSAELTHNQASIMYVTMDVIEDGEISFYYRVACEYSPSGDYFYDGLIFSIDGETMNWLQPEGNGQSPWTFTSFPVSAGMRTFSWAFVKDNSDGNTYIEEDAAYVDYIIFPTSASSGPSELEVTVDYMSDWNMVGLSVNLEETHYESLFPNSIPNTLYSFSEGYLADTHLETGTGYLLRFSEAAPNTLNGMPLDNLTISLTENWNLISGISFPLDVNTVIDLDNLIIPGTVYGFEENGYALAETIEPGYGYWLRSSADGEIMLSSSAPAGRTRSVQPPKSFNTITVGNQQLYFGENLSEENLLSYSLPPKPPIGASDIRFPGDTKLCTSDECVIEMMHDGQPTTFEFDIKNNEKWKIVPVIASKTQWSEAINLIADQLLTIDSIADQFILKKSTSASTPAEFSLFPAYPNPFNPQTTISFGLPLDSDVSISVFNLMGQKVSTLASGNLPAGIHTVKWNGISDNGVHVSAGVYLYTIETEEFREMKKIILMK
ncbi:MAG: C25 family cysteine peptidase [Candidatus Marinimicrobia bacterium]|jgi:hypothetical protein|nr:C25 family cysteine peptidase [Candidatus Neomarinimicrobiota bacterium]